MKLDIKDKKLLYYLAKDCRQSDVQLSRRLELSKSSVKYRRDRLEKEGIIKGYSITMDLGPLNLNTFVILMRFNEDIKESNDIISYFKKNPFSNWVAELSGNWDILVEFVVKDLFHLNDILNNLISHFQSKLNSYEIIFSMKPIRDFLLVESFYNGLNVPKIDIKNRPTKLVETDLIDKKILNELSKNSAQSYLDISRNLNLSLDIVRYRMKKIFDNDLILRCCVEPDLKLLGYTQYFCTIELNNLDNEELSKLIASIRLNTDITYAFFDITSSKICISCAFKESNGVDILLRWIRKRFFSMVGEQRYYIITKHHKFQIFPKGLIN